jgi:tetratricopeptide (TPR) repeat protein
MTSLTSADPARVELLCDLERWADALPLVSRLLATDPDNEVTWCLLAQCHLGLDRYEPALSAAERAAALAPDNEWPYRLISFAATHLGRHEQAVTAARAAIRLEPDAWQTHARLAAALARRDAGHQRRGLRAGLGRGSRRRSKVGQNEAAEAAEAAERALALAPDEAQVQLIYGSVAANQGRRAEAERAYRAALVLDPQSSGAHHLLAALQLHRQPGPAGLAGVATGFETALTADPKAQVSRRSLELTLRVFIGRAAYGLFLVAYVSQLFAGQSALWARAIPVLLLSLPTMFVLRFVHRLSPQLRSFLQHLLRRGSTAVAAGLEALSVALVLAGVLAPQPVRPVLAITAAVIALLARLTFYLDTRKLTQPSKTSRPKSWLRR